MRFKFHILKVHAVALILLSAILSGAFSFGLFQSKSYASAAMVYCPLTKRLQPVNPPTVAAPVFSLNEICANDSEKTRLKSAIAENLKFKFSNLNQKILENLAFDFWQKGKTAFDALPNTPNAPEKFAVKNTFSAVALNDHPAFKIIWKTTEKFAFQMQPRPPTAIDFPSLDFIFTLKLEYISRRIAPRAPPVSV